MNIISRAGPLRCYPSHGQNDDEDRVVFFGCLPGFEII